MSTDGGANGQAPAGDEVDAEPSMSLGSYIKLQRRLAKLSLRQLADLAEVSNPYLSQVERGLHAPSVRVLRLIARALNLSAETLLEQSGLFGEGEHAHGGDAESAIRSDPHLSESQKEALLNVYRSFRSTRPTDPGDPGTEQREEP